MYICGLNSDFGRYLFCKKTKQCKMIKERRQDLYTQSEYAKLKGITRARVNQLVTAGNLQTLSIKGATLIKV